MPHRPLFALVALLAALAVTAVAAVIAPPSARGQTEIVCGDEEEAPPAVDENGILLDPDDSTEADRANDYDDSAEDEEIPEDEGDELSPEERAALGDCLGEAADDAFATAADVFDAAWDARKSVVMGTFGSDQLPYGGTVEFTLERAGTARVAKKAKRLLGRAKLTLRSGDTKKLKFRLNRRGAKALKGKGRIVAIAKLELTDELSGLSRTAKGRVVLELKR